MRWSMPLLAPIRALVCCAALASLAGLGAGCSVIVDGELNNRGSDSGVGGQTCMFDAQCISFDPFNCNRVCGPEGRCIDGPAPDGTRCGMGGPQHCVAQVCVMRVCGDGYVDRNASPPEYCDDGNMVDTDSCNNACTRSLLGPGARQLLGRQPLQRRRDVRRRDGRHAVPRRRGAGREQRLHDRHRRDRDLPGQGLRPVSRVRARHCR